MIKYGLISEVDARCLEKTIDIICDGFKDEWLINVLEVGVYGGQTGEGVRKYCHSKGKEIMLTGIDNNRDGEEIKYYYDKLIKGNSNEVYNQIEDDSQHLIFVDGCHCFAHVVSDFFCYLPKVKIGGYLAFHDTGEHIKPFKDFQHGDKNNPDAYISVRKALESIRAISQVFIGVELIFDEADETNEAGGITVFKKLY